MQNNTSDCRYLANYQLKLVTKTQKTVLIEIYTFINYIEPNILVKEIVTYYFVSRI